jgi:sirohydrochlorin cobaltochelatase
VKPPAVAGPAIILFAHGARDERWAEPFARIVSKVRAAAPGLLIELAYLEHLEPSLDQAARRLAKLGATTIRVVPLFLGRGGHLRVDVPRLITAAGASLTGVAIELAPSAGEDDAVIDALAAYCVRAVRAAAKPSR